MTPLYILQPDLPRSKQASKRSFPTSPLILLFIYFYFYYLVGRPLFGAVAGLSDLFAASWKWLPSCASPPLPTRSTAPHRQQAEQRELFRRKSKLGPPAPTPEICLPSSTDIKTRTQHHRRRKVAASLLRPPPSAAAASPSRLLLVPFLCAVAADTNHDRSTSRCRRANQPPDAEDSTEPLTQAPLNFNFPRCLLPVFPLFPPHDLLRIPGILPLFLSRRRASLRKGPCRHSVHSSWLDRSTASRPTSSLSSPTRAAGLTTDSSSAFKI